MMIKPPATPKVLHLHSTFAAGGKELRAVGLMNAFGDALEHTIVSGQPDHLQARAHIDAAVIADFPDDFPSLTGRPTPGRLAAIAKAMKPFDLVLTYNWGAMDAVLAHRVFAKVMGLPALIHHEDGFNEDEAGGLKKSRNWMRQLALQNAHKLVVPSSVLENIALRIWKQPAQKVHRIVNGIDTLAFSRRPKPTALPIKKGEDEIWIGTLAGLRGVKQLTLLVESCAAITEDWRLVILGEGPERAAIEAKACSLGVENRVHLPGAHKEPAKVIGLFDIFALSSKSEQFPLSVVEAMAASLPVAAPDVGDVKAMVSVANQPFIVPSGRAGTLGEVLADLASNDSLRREVGARNREKAQAHFDAQTMIETYRELYWGAMKKT
ncbi:MAG: glycosyltransferase family 4 protein [Erythrobacter sp.]|uniref:glycosyltransferase family 4 protein n=1 Tax=Erythrobacter sp. TaxID=1042 RepID=UPI003262D673